MDSRPLLPRNREQKLGAFAGIAVALLLLALHNPFSGYVTTAERIPISIPGLNLFPCEDGWEREDGGTDWFCQDGRQVRRLPFAEWRTEAPAFAWIGRPANLLMLLVIDALAAVAWLLLFRPEKSA
ncbi:MAG: hypothetical protein K0S16_1924 [Moraxellaceae bacterium]|jgi:hypothetical protein|nr:hypothetical protein [Moraxellaceae bacterium]